MFGGKARREGSAEFVSGEAEFEGAGEVGDGPGADVVGFALIGDDFVAAIRRCDDEGALGFVGVNEICRLLRCRGGASGRR